MPKASIIKKDFVRYFVTFCILIIAYLAFAFSSLYLPESRIKHAIEKSVVMGDIKTDYPRAIVNKEVCRMDQYSDALILNQAYCASREDPINSIMMVPSIGDDTNKTAWLNTAVTGVTEPVNIYPRYWHGSTFLTRWVMLFCGRYANMQLFLFYTSSIVFFLLFLLLCRRKKMALALCLFIPMLLLKSYLAQFSIHLYPVFLISTIAAILSLLISSRNRQRLLFFITGSLTAYFDLMTAPLLTLGIPLLVILSDEKIREEKLWTIIKEITIIALLWGLGYASTWIFKWELATWLTGSDVIADAISTSFYRINGNLSSEMTSEASFTIWDAVYANISKCPMGLILALVLLLAITAVFAFDKKGIKKAVVFSLVSLIPIIYYMALSNQTLIHCWFTYRALIITIAGILMAMASLVDWKKFRKQWHQQTTTTNS